MRRRRRRWRDGCRLGEGVGGREKHLYRWSVVMLIRGDVMLGGDRLFNSGIKFLR